MADRAHVGSSEAIDRFRSSLVTYLTKMRPLLEDACDEAFRTRDWLHNEKRIHWENEVRRRHRALEEAKAALFSAKISNLRDARAAEHMAVERAKRAMADAEEKLRKVKHWSTDFEHRSQILVKDLEHVRSLMANEMPKAVAHLVQIMRRVDEYVRVGMTAPAGAADLKVDAPETWPAGDDAPASESK
jgi:hypothetical protein